MLRSFDGALQDANRSARAAYRELSQRGFDEVEDVVPGARTVLVLLKPGREPSSELVAVVETDPELLDNVHGHHHEIPVRYGNEDLGRLAVAKGMTHAEFIEMHAAPRYTVGFIGFSPGFPYLFGLPPELAAPRLATPRTAVPAGSVAIGGEYTGIYPTASPGGWHILGSTDFVLFDASRVPPATLSPGDTVRFIAV
jgi:KipI family sensor histidine kinase inhibitor